MPVGKAAVKIATEAQRGGTWKTVNNKNATKSGWTRSFTKVSTQTSFRSPPRRKPASEAPRAKSAQGAEAPPNSTAKRSMASGKVTPLKAAIRPASSESMTGFTIKAFGTRARAGKKRAPLLPNAAVEIAARGNANLMPRIVDAVEARCTLGGIADRLRAVFGVHRDQFTL